METKLPGWGSKYYQIGRDCLSHKMAQKNFTVYFRFCHYVLLKLENSFLRSKLCPSSWLPLLWCCFREKSRKGSRYEQYCCTSLPTSSPTPGDGRTQTSAPLTSQLVSLAGTGGQVLSLLLLQKATARWWSGETLPTACWRGLLGDLGLHGEIGHCYIVWAISCWRFFCSVINHYWKPEQNIKIIIDLMLLTSRRKFSKFLSPMKQTPILWKGNVVLNP